MVLVRAVVTKLATDDGLVALAPHVRVGTTYVVDVATIRRAQTMVHRHPDGTWVSHAKDVVWTAEGTWLPLDCLRLTV
jgi:hypothetical protein